MSEQRPSQCPGTGTQSERGLTCFVKLKKIRNIYSLHRTPHRRSRPMVSAIMRQSFNIYHDLSLYRHLDRDSLVCKQGKIVARTLRKNFPRQCRFLVFARFLCTHNICCRNKMFVKNFRKHFFVSWKQKLLSARANG